VCFWEDDDVQFRDPHYAGGANSVSLIEARANFVKFAASAEAHRGQVRAPSVDESASRVAHSN
jgi:hypothetical protein